MEYKHLYNDAWKGLNIDLSEEKLTPDTAHAMENLRIGREGNPIRVLGFTKKLALTDLHIENAEIFKTRGQDYIFINGSDGKIYIYYFSTLTLKEKIKDSAGDDLVLTEPVWFANYLNHMWFGNMVEGVYRWREGLEPELIRGHAPIDIIAEIYDIPSEEEYIYKKDYMKFQFAYDYEYRGGRSALSRPTQVNLGNPYQQIKIIMDKAPLISKNRQIYARHTLKEIPTGADADWSDWYLMKIVEENSEISVILNEELVLNLTSEDAYEIPTESALSPLAKYTEVFDGRLFLGYMVESPTMVSYTDIAKPYFQGTNYFELREPITNIVALGQYLIASTLNSLYALRVTPTQRVLLTGAMGAYPNSMNRVANKVCFANSYGRWEYDQKGIRRIGNEEYLTADSMVSAAGIDTLDLTGLEKPKRYFLLTSKSDFDRGWLRAGISTDVVPGAITLKPTYTIGLSAEAQEGILATATDTVRAFRSESVANWRFNSWDKYRAIPVKIDGDVTYQDLIKALTLRIKRIGSGEGEYCPEIRYNLSGQNEPDMSSGGLLATVPFGVIGAMQDRTRPLSQDVLVQEETLFWIVLPLHGITNSGYRLTCAYVDGDNERFYEHGYIQSSSSGNEGTWSEEEIGGKKRLGYFTLHGKSAYHLSLLKADYVGATNTGFTTTPNKKKYAHKFTATSEIIPDWALIAYYGKTGTAVPAKINVKVLADIFDSTLGDEGEHRPDWADVIAQATGSDADIVEIANTCLLECDLSLQGAYEHLEPGTDYWFSIEAIDDPANHYILRVVGSEIPEVHRTGVPQDIFPKWQNVTYDTDTLVTIYQLYSCWFQLYGSMVDEEEEGLATGFAEQGVYVTPVFHIGTDGVFDNGYFTTAKPKESTIVAKKALSTDGESWTAWLTFNSGDAIGASQYKYVKFRIQLNLGDSEHTPAFDSLLVTWHKTGDTGDVLYAGVVKGEYWLSRCDKDKDASADFTYIRNKYNLWYPISESFWKYISVDEDIVYAIGRKDKDAYKKLYQLELGTRNYLSDTPVDIAAYWESGWLLSDNLVKHFRKYRFTITATDKNKIKVTIYVDSTGNDYSYTIDGLTGHQSYCVSLPDDSGFTAKGKRIKIKIECTALATDESQIHEWYIEDYDIEYWELPRRNM